jgi:hypothetical protein
MFTCVTNKKSINNDNNNNKKKQLINTSVQFKLQYHTLIISNKTLKKN